MIVVSNTTPLIGLASIQQFDLLAKLFGEIHIPQAVYDEAYLAERAADAVKYSARWEFCSKRGFVAEEGFGVAQRGGRR